MLERRELLIGMAALGVLGALPVHASPHSFDEWKTVAKRHGLTYQVVFPGGGVGFFESVKGLKAGKKRKIVLSKGFILHKKARQWARKPKGDLRDVVLIGKVGKDGHFAARNVKVAKVDFKEKSKSAPFGATHDTRFNELRLIGNVSHVKEPLPKVKGGPPTPAAAKEGPKKAGDGPCAAGPCDEAAPCEADASCGEGSSKKDPPTVKDGPKAPSADDPPKKKKTVAEPPESPDMPEVPQPQ